MSREVLLIGGGHAHVEVIRRWAISPVAGASLVVLDPNPRPVYSGMVPGFVAGQYRREELEIDLEALCRRAGADFIRERASAVDPARHCARLARGDAIQYDVASIDIGSTVAGADLPGVREFGLSSRPITGLLSKVDSFVSRARRDAAGDLHVNVVGAGAGGVELAFCLDARLRSAGCGRYIVSLVTSEPGILSGAAACLRRRVLRSAKRRGICRVVDARVDAIREDRIELASGSSLPSSATLWVTGPAARPFARDSGLPVDPRGFVLVEPTLQVGGQEHLLAVGDCASLPGMKKAGVYAVRCGPILDHNIRALIFGKRLRAFSPQSDFLSLLNLGDGTAIGTKWGLALAGPALMRLKDRIDRSFMEKYR